MRAFAIKEKETEIAFGKLIKQWLRAILPESIQLQHQKCGQPIVNIRLFVNVGDFACYCTAPVRCHTPVLQPHLGHVKAWKAILMPIHMLGCRLQGYQVWGCRVISL